MIPITTHQPTFLSESLFLQHNYWWSSLFFIQNKKHHKRNRWKHLSTLIQFNVCNLIFFFFYMHSRLLLSLLLSLESCIILQERTTYKKEVVPVEAWDSWWDSWGITSGSERSKMMFWYALTCLFIFFLALLLPWLNQVGCPDV